MSLQLLSIDVWQRIVSYLEPLDIVSLACTCKNIRKDLTTDQIWSSVVSSNWRSVLNSYNVSSMPLVDYTQTIVPSMSNLKLSQYEIGLRYLELNRNFLKHINKYDQEGPFNISVFLDIFTSNPDYIPILINYMNHTNSIDISRQSVAANLLIAQNYRQGFIKHLHDLQSMNLGRKTRLSDYEQLYLNFCYFDKSFHILLPYREIFYSNVRKLLKPLYEKDLIDKLDLENWAIHFDTEFQLVLFIIKLMKIVMRYITKPNKFRKTQFGREYLKSYFLEDFFILRVYAGETVGHKDLLHGILFKSIEMFFENYKIYINGKEYILQDNIHNVRFLEATIKIGNYYLLILWKSLTIEIELFQKEGIRYFFPSLDMNNPSTRQFNIEPQDIFAKWRQFYHTSLDHNSNSMEILYEKSNDTNEDFNDVMTPISRRCFTFDEYQFVTLVIDFITSNGDSSIISFFLEKIKKKLNQYNNFIHFNTIWEISMANNRQKFILDYYRVDNVTGKSVFNKFFNLNDPNHSQISWEQILSEEADNRYSIANPKDKFSYGTLVYHPKWAKYGVVLNKINVELFRDGNASRVYVGPGKSHIYSHANIEKVPQDDKVEFNNQLLKFINNCGIDIFGLLYVKGYDPSTGKFIPVNLLHKSHQEVSDNEINQ